MNVPMIQATPLREASDVEPGTGMGDEVAIATTSVPVPPRSLTTSKGFLAMITGIARHAIDHKAVALWQFVRYAISATYFWVGGTFLFGGDHVHVEPTYHLIENIEPGGVRVHGFILFLLAIWVASKPAFKKQTSYGLLATLFYSLLSTLLICGGWVLNKPDLSAPAWYLLMAALSFALIVSAPLTTRGRAARGGGSRA